jgi:hypothetical protein
MPFYTQKPFRVEIIEVTAENINNVFTWVSSSNAVNAHSLTSNSFVMEYSGNPNGAETVTVGCYVARRTNDSFGVMQADRMAQRWNLLTNEEANSLPTINRQTKSLDEAWTRFSEIVF